MLNTMIWFFQGSVLVCGEGVPLLGWGVFVYRLGAVRRQRLDCEKHLWQSCLATSSVMAFHDGLQIFVPKSLGHSHGLLVWACETSEYQDSRRQTGWHSCLPAKFPWQTSLVFLLCVQKVALISHKLLKPALGNRITSSFYPSKTIIKQQCLRKGRGFLRADNTFSPVC